MIGYYELRDCSYVRESAVESIVKDPRNFERDKSLAQDADTRKMKFASFTTWDLTIRAFRGFMDQWYSNGCPGLRPMIFGYEIFA